MQNIIVPIDFSEQSEYALKTAASLASKFNSGIIVLHMLELSSTMIASEGLGQQQIVLLLKASEKKLAKFLDKPYLKGINLTPIIKHYKVFSEVNEIAKDHDAELIVMGSHGVDGLKEFFIGSNTERVVRHAEIPVLVVKEDMQDFRPKTMVFPSDFVEEDINAFKKAKDFAEKMSMEIQLVYVNTPDTNFLSTEDAYDRILTFLSSANAGMEVDIYNDYTVEKGILNYSNSANADIIGISTHGRKGLSHLFKGSIGEDVANHSTLPVITFKI